MLMSMTGILVVAILVAALFIGHKKLKAKLLQIVKENDPWNMGGRTNSSLINHDDNFGDAESP